MNNAGSLVLSRSNVHVSGRGRQALVLLHGLGCTQAVWQPLLPAFEAHYRVVRLDLVGTGGSRLGEYSRERHGSLAGHATDLLDVLRTLDLSGAVFVGHSIGAMIGVLAAVREPARFANLVLLAPSPRFLNGRDYAGGFEPGDVEELLASLENNQDEWAQAFAPVAIGDASRPDLIMGLTSSFASTNPGVLRHLARVAFFNDSRLALPLLSTPALIVQPARDMMVPLGVGYYLHEQLPDSQLVIINTSGHFPHLTAPEATLAAIGRFLGCPLALPAGTAVSWDGPGCCPVAGGRVAGQPGATPRFTAAS
ncbi:alpha/beta fold hydrolase [Hymenobacter cyanobacteriorum]|uniref:alpha/beta fold hydrolase n=1 Tax=Hymenobacter cyanobacteriorum TaxID=2926463 RepID=UPI003BB0E769